MELHSCSWTCRSWWFGASISKELENHQKTNNNNNSNNNNNNDNNDNNNNNNNDNNVIVTPIIKLLCNNKISFLDISVTRKNNKLTKSLYRKKTFSDVYLNFNSFLPMDYKKGLIHTPLFRAYNICADYVTLHTEIEFLKSIWQRNSFPLFFIDKCIKRFLDKLFIKRNISGTVSKKKEVFICLEFLGKISLQNKKTVN